MTHNNNHDQEVDVIAETDNYFVWRSTDEDGTFLYHVELGGVSLHMISEEWEELITLVKTVGLS
jgi:hypothetical protein